MIGDIDWEDLDVAGAFVLGTVLATVAVLRVVRAVSVMFRQERRKDRDDSE
jgi:ABC-type sulfate transport system permease subunit